MSDFKLHPRLEADTFLVGDWPLSRLLLMNDARYPWLILVPRRIGVSEISDLDESDRVMLIEEIAHASAGLKRISGVPKINIGALGNLVPQLHIHVVARSSGDAAWPGPVWGHGSPAPLARGARETFLSRWEKEVAPPARLP
jgi:diadenosine tetraphosphate (Ap4A) HIT family hydrolase